MIIDIRVCRSLCELGFNLQLNPQLALWATEMTPAMRARNQFTGGRSTPNETSARFSGRQRSIYWRVIDTQRNVGPL
jgi:hypothetical protein